MQRAAATTHAGKARDRSQPSQPAASDGQNGAQHTTVTLEIWYSSSTSVHRAVPQALFLLRDEDAEWPQLGLHTSVAVGPTYLVAVGPTYLVATAVRRSVTRFSIYFQYIPPPSRDDCLLVNGIPYLLLTVHAEVPQY